MSGFRERAERARLNLMYRGDDGTDVSDDPTELLRGDEHGQCEVCGRESATAWCRACQLEDETGRRW